MKQAKTTRARADRMGRGGAKGNTAVLEFLQEKTGIYSLGFSKESFLGLMIPIAFVLLIGGLGAAMVFFM